MITTNEWKASNCFWDEFPFDGILDRYVFTHDEKNKQLNIVRKNEYVGDTDGDENIPLNYPMPSRIHFNGPVTVVIWEDGSKTVVRRAKDIPDDPYAAFCAALAKKVYGNNSRVKKILHDKTYVPKKKKKTFDKDKNLLDWDGNPTMREEK